MNKIIENIIKQEPFVGEDGLDYIKVTKEILTPRKTYLKGTISGKYRGDKIPDVEGEHELYDFEIYEAEVNCNSIDDFSKNKPFVFPNDFKNITDQKKIKGNTFPKSKLPEILPVIISANNKTFGINVLEPKLYEFSIIRKLHQIEDNQVFGSFNAFITGFVLDYEKELKIEINGPIKVDPPPPPPPSCKWYETGKSETKPNYIRYEYECKVHDHKKWGKWIFTKNDEDIGCIGFIFQVIGFFLLISFIISFFPIIGYLIVFSLIMLLINWLLPYIKWIMDILGILFLFSFLFLLIYSWNNRKNYNPPIPTYVDSNREKIESIEPIIDDSIKDNNIDTLKTINDTLIKKFRVWKDYDGNVYEGYYILKKSDIVNSKNFKNNLQISMNNEKQYDRILFDLKENDKEKLNALYKLFDSIGKSNKLNNLKFAEMIVSFVQDIPYVLILEKDCDPNLYADNFTRSYLRANKGKCSGYQKFGINTPIEFLYNLNGDCDTRTLLLYTILSHYNYDVAILSSEFYGHSILGINLPMNGLTFKYQNQNYVLWETTQRNIKPGKISIEISNLNYWRISLKSK